MRPAAGAGIRGQGPFAPACGRAEDGREVRVRWQAPFAAALLPARRRGPTCRTAFAAGARTAPFRPPPPPSLRPPPPPPDVEAPRGRSRPTRSRRADTPMPAAAGDEGSGPAGLWHEAGRIEADMAGPDQTAQGAHAAGRRAESGPSSGICPESSAQFGEFFGIKAPEFDRRSVHFEKNAGSPAQGLSTGALYSRRNRIRIAARRQGATMIRMLASSSVLIKGLRHGDSCQGGRGGDRVHGKREHLREPWLSKHNTDAAHRHAWPA